MEPKDPYLQPRADITENLDLMYINEVGGLCPLCGDTLLKQKRKRVNKQYQIAHIYPNSPNKHQLEELKGLERLGENSESYENKIALCKKCHGNYDNDTQKEEYLKILNIKKKLLEKERSSDQLAVSDIEDEISLVIESLSGIREEVLVGLELSYTALKVSSKIENDYFLLRRKIENNVCIYYKFIKQLFKNLEEEKKLIFNIVALQIKTAYMKCANTTQDKSIIFNAMVVWVKSKANSTSNEACEVVVSFFVQNCEVFDEIAK